MIDLNETFFLIQTITDNLPDLLIRMVKVDFLESVTDNFLIHQLRLNAFTSKIHSTESCT
jgi:hypothetical protein